MVVGVPGVTQAAKRLVSSGEGGSGTGVPPMEDKKESQGEKDDVLLGQQPQEIGRSRGQEGKPLARFHEPDKGQDGQAGEQEGQKIGPPRDPGHVLEVKRISGK